MPISSPLKLTAMITAFLPFAAASALPILPDSALPPGWYAHGQRDAAQCGAETSNIRYMQWAPKGSNDVFGRGYAHTYLGFIFINNSWPSFAGEINGGNPVVDITMNNVSGFFATRKYSTKGKLIQVRPGMLFVYYSGKNPQDDMRRAMNAASINVKLPYNYRGYQEALITTGVRDGDTAFKWYRQNCDNWKVN